MRETWIGWAVDLMVGLVVGTIAGLIVAANVLIYGGTESGYETSLSRAFEDRPVVGVLTVVGFFGPIVAAVIAMRWMRRLRQ